MDSRQPYAVSPLAGMQHSAEGWGTGRAVARVPRVKGSGTRRAGQGAFANFCRKGRLAHPTSINRKWHRKVQHKEKMIAMAMGIAATANPSIVEARGHRINNLESIPFVVSNEVYNIKKTKEAQNYLIECGFKDEIERCVRTVRAGIGKMRNRKYRSKRGILLVHCGDELKAFRNIQGLEMMDITKPDLLKICPGGNMGRLVIWTEDAIMKVDEVFENVNVKKMISQDLDELFYKPEVQAILEVTPYQEKIRNGNEEFMRELNPYLGLYEEVFNQ